MKNAFFLSAIILVFGITFALFSCQKEADSLANQTAISYEMSNQSGQSITSQAGAEDRTGGGTCPCAATGCNGPATMTITVIEKVGNATLNITLPRACGAKATTSCITLNNATVGSSVTGPIAYSIGPNPVGSTNAVRYLLSSIFVAPNAGNSAKIRVNAPGINNVDFTVTPTTPIISLYPYFDACY